MSECMVCDRIELTKKGENPYFVRELETGYVVIGDYQRFYGYTVFICKQHASELFQLEKDFKMSRFFTDKYSKLVPYTPGEQPKDRVFIKLNTNENPNLPDL